MPDFFFFSSLTLFFFKEKRKIKLYYQKWPTLMFGILTPRPLVKVLVNGKINDNFIPREREGRKQFDIANDKLNERTIKQRSAVIPRNGNRRCCFFLSLRDELSSDELHVKKYCDTNTLSFNLLSRVCAHQGTSNSFIS